jgi:hypothetical protein
VGDQGRQAGWTLLLGDLVLLAMAIVLVKAPLRAAQTEPAEAEVPVAQA